MKTNPCSVFGSQFMCITMFVCILMKIGCGSNNLTTGASQVCGQKQISYANCGGWVAWLWGQKPTSLHPRGKTVQLYFRFHERDITL